MWCIWAAATATKKATPAKKQGDPLAPLAKQLAMSYQCSEPFPLQVRAMVLAKDTLFVAGPPEVLDEEQALVQPDDPLLQAKIKEQGGILKGEKGFQLWAATPSNGRKLAEYQFESLPVFDGMVAANGRLYLASMDGTVTCLAGRSSRPGLAGNVTVCW